jgi:hypothetical protein
MSSDAPPPQTGRAFRADPRQADGVEGRAPLTIRLRSQRPLSSLSDGDRASGSAEQRRVDTPRARVDGWRIATGFGARRSRGATSPASIAAAERSSRQSDRGAAVTADALSRVEPGAVIIAGRGGFGF